MPSAVRFPPHAEPVMTEEQAQPDAEFPTVKFPNPEEGDGTWSLCFQAAEKAGTPLAVANDPDADRLAVAERDPSLPLGWRTFSGNEIGILLADWALTVFREKNPGVPMSEVAMLTTIVSSKMMAAMAAKEGFRFEQTLTGFKWLGNVAKDLEAQGYRTVFAFEEAIGFMFGTFEKVHPGSSPGLTQHALHLLPEAMGGSTTCEHTHRHTTTMISLCVHVLDPPPPPPCSATRGINSCILKSNTAHHKMCTGIPITRRCNSLLEGGGGEPN